MALLTHRSLTQFFLNKTLSNVGEKMVIGFEDGSIQLFSFASLVRDFSCKEHSSGEMYSPRETNIEIVEEKNENTASCGCAMM